MNRIEEPYMGLYADRNKAVAATVQGDKLIVTLGDGRIVHCPLSWFPWLANATPEQQADLTVMGASVFWNALDDGISMEPILLGRPNT